MFEEGHTQTMCLCVTYTDFNIRTNLSDLQNSTLHFRPMYGTSGLSTDAVLPVGLYHSIQETGKFGQLQNKNNYYHYNSRDILRKVFFF